MQVQTKSKIETFMDEIPAISIKQNLGEALDLLLAHNLDKAAVINEKGNFIGYIRYQEILELYFSKLRK